MNTKNKKKIEEIVENMTLMDDELMSRVFDENIEATNLLLKVILKNESIKTIKVKGQTEFKNPLVGGRSICLDILAKTSEGKHFNIEVQRKTKGASLRRARFHSSMLDVRMLKEGQDFTELDDSYVVFIVEKDVFKRGEPIYEILRSFSDTKQDVNDGSHIIYVNGQYEGDDSLGRLLHDFRCVDVNQMYYPILKEGTRQFKKGEGGHKTMSDVVEQFAQEYAQEYAQEKIIEYATNSNKELARKMIKRGKLSLEEIADYLNMDIEDLQKLTQEA